ncbi:MAG: c-type cytochrome [Ilumatobacteraceae bacterium]
MSRVKMVVIRVLGAPCRTCLAVVVIACVAWPAAGLASTVTRQDDPLSVRTVYLRDCAVCHAPDGSGTSRGPTLKGQGAAGVDFMLTTGRMPLPTPKARMHRSAPSYSAAVIAALDDYVATLQPGGPGIPKVDLTAASLTTGGSIYREQCAACHQAAGEGGVLLGQNSPSLLESTPVQVAEAIRNGPGTMPVFGTTAISDGDVAAVAKYVVALAHTDDPGGFPLGHLGPLPEGAIALLAIGAIILALRQIGSQG